MTTLTDAKLTALETLTGNVGHIQDLELQYLLLLITGPVTATTIVDLWSQVFDEATIPAGQHNDRWMAYMDSILAPATQDHYNEREREYWEGGGTPLGPVVPQPPLPANLLHWFDATDSTQVFSDTAGLIPAVDGAQALRVNNKGTDGTAIIDSFPAGPIYRVDVIMGPTGITYSGVRNTAGFPSSLQNSAWTGQPSGVSGIHMAAFARKTYDGAFTNNLWNLSSGGGVVGLRADNATFANEWAGTMSNNPQPSSSLAPVVLDKWSWVEVGNQGAASYYRAAGFPEVLLAGAFVAPTVGGAPTLFQMYGEVTEVLIYDRGLTQPERDLVTAYFDAKYGVAPFAAPPPTVADLIHWFDFTDPATVFKNPPATQQAIDGDFIRQVTNKGSDGTPINSASDVVSPILRTGIVNGLQIADYDVTTQTLDAVIAAGHASSSAGLSMAIIFKWISGPGVTNSMAAWGSNLARTAAARNGQFFVAGAPGNISSLAPLGADTWYLGAFAFDGGLGTDRWQWSGEALQTAALGNLTDILAGSTLEIANAAVLIQVAEFAIWDGQLSAGEFTDLFAYADAKYGTLPIAPPPPPPAPGNLVHHVEPGDASTVWADAAATIPAIDGGVVARIDNKGTDGTPLATSTGGPIYRTGVLNGTNVIDFSGARLEALAVAAGLTISTTGFTIAMVTRRRAGHIGDSILWRWTPFAGTPGPSIRGKFSLNGNFARTDPLVDEQLVANPSVIDQWYLMYWSVDPAGAVDDAKFGSPGPEIITPFGVPTDIAPASDVRYGTSSTFVSHSEAWFWNRPLTLAERAALVVLADTKYGTLPHL